MRMVSATTSGTDYESIYSIYSSFSWSLKYILNRYLVQVSVFVITYNDNSIISDEPLLTCDKADFISTEAYQRSTCYAFNIMMVWYSPIVGYTCDINALLLLTFVAPLLKDFCVDVFDSYCRFELSGQLRFDSVDEINSQSLDSTCKMSPFFHADIACNSLFAFFNQSKAKFLNCYRIALKQIWLRRHLSMIM